MEVKQKQEKSSYLNKKRRDIIFISLMLTPALLHFLVFYLYVNFQSFFMAFQNKEMINGEANLYWTLENFERFFREIADGNSTIVESIKNTLIAFVVNIGISFPLQILCCYVFFKKVPGNAFFRIVFFLPSIVSGVVLVMMFQEAITADGVIYTYIWKGIMGHPDTDYYLYPKFLQTEGLTYGIIQFFDLWSGLGYGIIIMSGALYRIPTGIFESAKIDGVNIFEEFIHIVLPLMWPTISTYLIYKVAGIFTYTGPILLFDKNCTYGTSTIGYFIFSQVKFGTGVNKYYYASTVGFIFTMVGLPLILGVKSFIMKHSENVSY